MAVEDIIQVKSVEWFEGNKGKYPKYTYTGQKGESTKAVFDTELQKVLSEALENHLACSITLDKKDKYWNITTAKLVVDQIDAKPPIKKESGGVKQQDGMTPDKWDEKDKITRASIEGQVALKILADLTIAGIKMEDCPDLLSETLRTKIRGFAGISSSNPQPA